MSEQARRAAMARKPAKRVDPMIHLNYVTITTSQWLRLNAMAEATRVSEVELIRVAIAQMVKCMEPR